MPDELVFYTNPMSRGRIVRWMLEEIGQPYRTEIIEFGPAMKSPEYPAINPMGKVPAIRHGDTTVTEAGGIWSLSHRCIPAGRRPLRQGSLSQARIIVGCFSVRVLWTGRLSIKASVSSRRLKDKEWWATARLPTSWTPWRRRSRLRSISSETNSPPPTFTLGLNSVGVLCLARSKSALPLRPIGTGSKTAPQPFAPVRSMTRFCLRRSDEVESHRPLFPPPVPGVQPELCEAGAQPSRCSLPRRRSLRIRCRY